RRKEEHRRAQDRQDLTHFLHAMRANNSDAARKQTRRRGEKRRAKNGHKLRASAQLPAREFIRAAMKKTKTLPEAPGVFSGNGAKGIPTKAGGPVRNS